MRYAGSTCTVGKCGTRCPVRWSLPKRTLIVGASGFIGHYLVQRLKVSSDWEVSGTYNSRRPEEQSCQWYPVDLTQPEQLDEAFSRAQPELVVHLAATADVGTCEREPDRARAVNVTGTENIVRLCGHSQSKSKLVYLSTEYVFDGERGNYTEDDQPKPTTVYGQTKWQAEQTVVRHSEVWTILRTSLVYGWPAQANRANLVTRVIDSLSRGSPAYGYTDQRRSPVYVPDLVEGLIKLMEGDYPGVCHVAGPDWVHMGQFVHGVAKAFHLDSSLIKETESQNEGSNGSRPSLLGLDSTQTIGRLGIQPRDLVSGLSSMQTIRREDL